MMNNISLLEGMKTNCGNDNIGLYPEKQKIIVELIKKTKPRNIIQIGFNMGFTSYLICDVIVSLKLNNNYHDDPVLITIFDPCNDECTLTNFEILSETVKEFNIFMNLIPEISLDTVPKFIDSNDMLFDFVEVDGCKTFECVTSYIVYTAPRVRQNGLIYINDYKSNTTPQIEVDKAIETIDWDGFETYNGHGVFWSLKQTQLQNKENVNHPNHYGGEENPYEAIKVIDAWDLGFSLGNTVKYISRAGKKDPTKELEDLKKAQWYLNHHITKLKSKLKQ